MTRAHIV